MISYIMQRNNEGKLIVRIWRFYKYSIIFRYFSHKFAIFALFIHSVVDTKYIFAYLRWTSAINSHWISTFIVYKKTVYWHFCSKHLFLAIFCAFQSNGSHWSIKIFVFLVSWERNLWFTPNAAIRTLSIHQ